MEVLFHNLSDVPKQSFFIILFYTGLIKLTLIKIPKVCSCQMIGRKFQPAQVPELHQRLVKEHTCF